MNPGVQRVGGIFISEQNIWKGVIVHIRLDPLVIYIQALWLWSLCGLCVDPTEI